MKKIKISRTALMPPPITHYLLTFVLLLKVFWNDLPQWAITLLIVIFVLLMGLLIWGQYQYEKVDPLDTYNQDPNPLEAFNQDMGIQSENLKKSFKDKVNEKMN